jgi:hypothetical protein
MQPLIGSIFNGCIVRDVNAVNTAAGSLYMFGRKRKSKDKVHYKSFEQACEDAGIATLEEDSEGRVWGDLTQAETISRYKKPYLRYLVNARQIPAFYLGHVLLVDLKTVYERQYEKTEPLPAGSVRAQRIREQLAHRAARQAQAHDE